MTLPRSGFALVAVLLLLLGIAAVSTAMIAAAARDGLVTRNAIDVAAARLAAESAVRRVEASWSAAMYDDVPIGEAAAVPGAAGRTSPNTWFDARVQRLDAHRFLIRGRGRVSRSEGDAPRAEARVGAIVRSLDIDALTQRFSIGIESAGAIDVRTSAVVGPATDTEAAPGCADSTAAIRTDPARLTIGAGAIIEGGVQLLPADSLATVFPNGLGFLDLGQLERIGQRLSPPSVSPAPVVIGGDCEHAARANWGDPAGGACGELAPLIFAPDGVVLDGGTGQGVLVADGDVVLRNGAVFRGIILTTGRLILQDGEVRGGVISKTGATLSGRMIPDACVVRDVLGGSAPLLRVYPPRVRRFIPLF